MTHISCRSRAALRGGMDCTPRRDGLCSRAWNSWGADERAWRDPVGRDRGRPGRMDRPAAGFRPHADTQPAGRHARRHRAAGGLPRRARHRAPPDRAQGRQPQPGGAIRRSQARPAPGAERAHRRLSRQRRGPLEAWRRLERHDRRRHAVRPRRGRHEMRHHRQPHHLRAAAQASRPPEGPADPHLRLRRGDRRALGRGLPVRPPSRICARRLLPERRAVVGPHRALGREAAAVGGLHDQDARHPRRLRAYEREREPDRARL